MTPMNEDFMLNIRLKEAISALHRIYLRVSDSLRWNTMFFY